MPLIALSTRGRWTLILAAAAVLVPMGLVLLAVTASLSPLLTWAAVLCGLVCMAAGLTVFIIRSRDREN